MKVVVLTTSYPRGPEDVAGVFVRDAVEHLRGAGDRRRRRLARDVPSLRARLQAWDRREPAAASLAGACDPALPALFRTRRPEGSARCGSGSRALAPVCAPRARDEKAVRRPALGHRCRARLAGEVDRSPGARAGSTRRVRLRSARGFGPRPWAFRTCGSCPTAFRFPDEVGEPSDPPHVLFVGRLSEEKGILELLAATEGIPRVLVGDGPLRDAVSDAAGFVPPDSLGPFFERASVVVCPSRREGYGVVAREAMAYGRPVVASAVGGLVDAVDDGITGLLVPPRDVPASAHGHRASAGGRGA